MAIDNLLFSAVRVSTFNGQFPLTAGSGFFYGRGDRLFLITSRHVFIDEPSGHHPDRIELVLHTDATDLTSLATMSILLYRKGMSQWRQAVDSGGEVDVAAIELDRSVLPSAAVLRCFREEDLVSPGQAMPPGTPVLVVGFPLGFFDTRHHLPVVRTGAIASAYGIRFQGQGYFLTDVRTHRGTSGAPVVMRDATADPTFPWKLLGVHSASIDMGNREAGVDETLGLNCVWYADVLRTLTLPADSCGTSS